MGHSNRILITSALPYANGDLHVGHIAGVYLPADSYARYCRSLGRETVYVCGSDDHGVPALLTARSEGSTVEQIVHHYHDRQIKDFKILGIEFDVYGRTSSPNHKKTSQEFFLKVNANGFLEKRRSKQLFDAEARMFLPDRYVKGTCPFCGDEALGDQCENCGKDQDSLELINPVSVITGTTPEVRETVHWYFRQDELSDALSQWLKSRKGWRATVKNFALGMLKQGLRPRPVTRDLVWGVPVPLAADPDAEDKVLYVWFDAPIGYITFTADWLESRGMERSAYQDWWKNPDVSIYHFIGEDNIVFHALMWPAMLMAEGSFQLPTNVVANSFVNIKFPGKKEEKISKSRGTAVWIGEYLKDHDPDPMRYYLTMLASENQRTAFKTEDLIRRNNDELVGTLGNFIHRTLTFAHKYFDGRVPRATLDSIQTSEIVSLLESLPGKIGLELDAFRFRNAMTLVMDLARTGNRFFDHQAPWKQRKENMDDCATTINVSLRIVRSLAILGAPFLPFSCAKTMDFLELTEEERSWDQASMPLQEGRQLRSPEPLFKKME